MRADDHGWMWPDWDRRARVRTPEEVAGIGAYVRHVRSLRTVVQAGGNTGMFARALAEFFDLVLTFEPDPDNYECLVQNLRDRTDVVAHPVALSYRADHLSLVRPKPDNCGAVEVAEASERGDVRAVSLDQLAPRDVDLIMLDVEGWEFPALTGAELTISEYRPVIAVELKGLGEPRWPDEVVRGLLRTWGYRLADRIGRDEVWTPSY